MRLILEEKAEIEQVLKALGDQPYREVALLISKIMQQLNHQPETENASSDPG